MFNRSQVIGPYSTVEVIPKYSTGIVSSDQEIPVQHVWSAIQMLISVSIFLVLFHQWRTNWGQNSNDFDPAKEFEMFMDYIRNFNCKKFAYTLLCFVIFTLFIFPLLFVGGIGFFIYRLYIRRILLKKYGQRFRGFLKGTDGVWAVENDFALSVINVMVLFEIDKVITEIDETEYSKLSADVLLALRKRLASRLLGDYKPFPKMFYSRTKDMGFMFWLDNQRFCIEDYVRYMPEIKSSTCSSNSKEYIQQVFSELANIPLPYEHSGSWEVLVSKNPISLTEKAEKNCKQVPVLFRIHHSLGDGIALLRLFLETVADKATTTKRDYWSICAKSRPKIYKFIAPTNSKLSYAIAPNTTTITTSNIRKIYAQINSWLNKTNFKMLSNLSEICGDLKTIASVLVQKGLIIFSAPASLVNQCAYQQIDVNSLHQTKLSGKKLLTWRLETETDGNLIKSIKSIKHHFVEARFSDIFLSALAISFEKYFTSKGELAPKYLTAVIPARITAEDPTFRLQNKFSVALQTIPINMDDQLVSYNKAERFYNKILKVKTFSDILRNSSDYFVNFWLMSYLPALLPESGLGYFSESPHSTLAVSNLPGPQTITKMYGFKISNIVFWLPNRGTTGIGISILSYASKLQLGIIVDRAIIDNQKDIEFLLENTIDEIHSMAAMSQLYTKRFSITEVIRSADFYTK